MSKIKIVIILIVLGLLSWLGVTYYNNLQLDPVEKKSVFIPIQINSSKVESVTKTLDENHLIKNKDYFENYLKGRNAKIKTDLYYLSKQMSAKEIVDALENKEYKKVNVTILADQTINTYSSVWNQQLNRENDNFKTLMKDKDFIKTLKEKFSFIKPSEMIKKDIEYYLEGYLIAGNYKVDLTWNYRKIVNHILNNTEKVYKKYKSKFKALNLSFHKLIALTSCLSAEDGDRTYEYKDISGVFWNRLNDGKLLQLDATFIYGYNHGYETRKNTDSPTIAQMQEKDESEFNTYEYKGVPVGAITSINEKQIQAILNPNKHDYYFYFHKDGKDGNRELVLSKTYEEHLQKLRR